MSTAFGHILAGTPDAAEQVFDYIMNTQPAYKKLGEAVKAFEVRFKEPEIYKTYGWGHARQLDQDRDRAVQGKAPAWTFLAAKAVMLARTDYRRSFPEGESGFMQAKMMNTVSVFDIMRLALQHRDRFGSTGLGGLSDKEKETWLYRYMSEVTKYAKTPVDHHNELPYGHMVAGTMTPTEAAKKYLSQTKYGREGKWFVHFGPGSGSRAMGPFLTRSFRTKSAAERAAREARREGSSAKVQQG